MNDLLQNNSHLGALLVRAETSDDELVWQEIASTARVIADALRIRDSEDEPRTSLGRTSLPQNISRAISFATSSSSVLEDRHVDAIYELFRVAANLCIDHAENRGHLLDAQVPEAILHLLCNYIERETPSIPVQPIPLPNSHLKLLRTAVGVLLNISVDHETAHTKLISLDVTVTLLKLSLSVYPPAAWLNVRPTGSVDEDALIEAWTLRSGLSNWTWRALSELKDESRNICGPDALPYLIPILSAFIPSSTTISASSSPLPPGLRTQLLQADFDALEEACALIESLALDDEDVRLSLARGLDQPAEHEGIPCFREMIDFIERGVVSPNWIEVWSSEEVERKRKSFGVFKGAIIKAVVEVTGEDKNEEVIWDTSDEANPGGAFISKMVQWLSIYANNEPTHQVLEDRDDLAICASLSLGNLTRRESQAHILLSAPYNLAPVLVSPRLLSVATDVKIKHGAIGLLKHIAQSSQQSSRNLELLRNVRVVEHLTGSGVWDERSNVMAEVVQIGAIGTAKHLCGTELESVYGFVLPSPFAPSAGLDQILGLIKRSDNITIKSEGTRILVNAVKTLWSSNPATTDERRAQAMRAILKPAVTEALAALIGRSSKYPILINEGVVALTLLATHTEVDTLVSSAILAPLAFEVPAPPQTPLDENGPSSTIVPHGPRRQNSYPGRALDMLITVLRGGRSAPTVIQVNGVGAGQGTRGSAIIPVEIRANVCVFFGQLGRRDQSGGMEQVKETVRPALEEIVSSPVSDGGRNGVLVSTASKVLGSWAAPSA